MCRKKMSIGFNRNRTQVAFEQLVGARTPHELDTKKNAFSEYVLTPSDTISLKSNLQQDAIDLFFNGILSFSEGIDSVFLKR